MPDWSYPVVALCYLQAGVTTYIASTLLGGQSTAKGTLPRRLRAPQTVARLCGHRSAAQQLRGWRLRRHRVLSV